MPYKCNYCVKKFGYISHLKRHEKTHLDTYDYQCGQCPKMFNDKSAKKQHEEKHTSHQFQCDICYVFFKEERLMNEHKNFCIQVVKTESSSLKKVYKCSLCPKEFPYPSHLRDHLETHNPSDTYKCKKCPKEFKVRRIFNEHMKKHEQKPYYCDICNNMFADEENLLNHKQQCLKLHAINKCKFCDKTFKYESLLRRHEETHNEGNSYQCKICPRKFKTKRSLDDHYKKHEVNKYQCEICLERWFDDKESFQAHKESCLQTQDYISFDETVLKDGNSKKIYKCKHCDKRFLYAAFLKKHEVTHDKSLARYECNYCNAKFYDKYELGRHSLTHSLTKQYLCEICQKRFTKKYHLTMHMRIHNKDKRFSCHLCELKFVQKITLQRHIQRTHTRSTIAEKAAKPNSLNELKDESRVVDKKIHKCCFCSYCAVESDKLHDHLLSHDIKVVGLPLLINFFFSCR